MGNFDSCTKSENHMRGAFYKSTKQRRKKVSRSVQGTPCVGASLYMGILTCRSIAVRLLLKLVSDLLLKLHVYNDIAVPLYKGPLIYGSPNIGVRLYIVYPHIGKHV